MKSFFILLFVFSYSYPKFCLGEDFSTLRVICTVSDDTIPITEKEDLSLDEVCSDVLYKVPLTKQSFYWQNALNLSDPVFSFRHRHPKLQLHISVHDSFLETMSPTEATSFISFLKKMNSSGLDIIVNPQNNLASLPLVLLNYQQILSRNFLGLSITLSRIDMNLIVKHGIEDLVDTIFLLPNNIKDHKDLSVASVNGLSTNKLVIGLSSVVFVVSDSEDRSNIPSITELCSGSNLSQWKPTIQPDDQVVWNHSEKKWKFVMQMGLAVINQMKTIYRNNSQAEILLFDVPFRLEDNPICLRHRTLFIDSLREAVRINGYESRTQRVKRDPSEPLAITTKPQMKLIEGSRLGKLLVFAVGDEDEKFRKYYRIHDEDSLLHSPVDNIILGYDDSGKIYDMYQAMPRELSQESILNTVHQYYVDKILGGGGGNAFGAVFLRPPNILVYPDASGNHPVPILVTWVRVANPVVRLMQRRTRKQSSTTTSSTTSMPSATHRMCTDSQNPFRRCFIPAGLMEILNFKSRSSTTPTTRKSTAMRNTTTKPLVPMNPHARADDLVSASHVTTLAALKVTIASLQSTQRSTLLPLDNKQESKLTNSKMANPSKKQTLCNWESDNSYLSCKTRKRRFVNTQSKRLFIKTLLAMPKQDKLSDEKNA